MTEAEFSRKLRKELKKQMPESEIIKIADQYTAGIPDFAVIVYGVTTWFELKLFTNKKLFEPIQYERLRRMGRGYYIFWGLKTGIVFHVWGSAEETRQRALQESHLDFDLLVERITKICTGEQ